MAAPNLIGATTINGRSTGNVLTTTSATMILSNASGSGKCYKVNTLNVTNISPNISPITVSYYSGASLTGTSFPFIFSANVPANATLTVIDKSTQYYLEENTSIGATATTANAIVVTLSYEDIS